MAIKFITAFISILYQFNKCLLQMNRGFVRSQESRGANQNEWFQYHFLGRKLSFLSKGHLL